MSAREKFSTRQNGHASPRSVAMGAAGDEVHREEIDIGEVIRANLLRLRRECGLSLGQLAELSGASLSTLEDLDSGECFPSIELLWNLAHSLDLPCTAFIEEPAAATSQSPQSARRSTFA